MSGPKDDSLIGKVLSFFAGSRGRKTSSNSSSSSNNPASETERTTDSDDIAEQLTCCSDRVHIAYRGVSDDRLYLAEHRNANEVKFFRPIGLRVFCAECRKRLL